MKISALLKKYKAILSYSFWGVFTTAVNMLVYYLCYDVCRIANVPSTITALIIAVTFAFITNKLFVFDSKSLRFGLILKEAVFFFAFRALSGILDVVIMYIAVDVFVQNAVLWKMISNILIIIINYVAGKFIVFKKK